MKKLLIKIAAVVVLLLVVGVIAAMFFLGSLMKKGVESVGPALTKTAMTIDKASLSVFTGSGSLDGFSMGNPEGFKTPFAMQVGHTSLGVNPASIFGDKIHITHVRVESPEITFEAQGLNLMANNLSKILDNVKAVTGGDQPAEQKPEAKSEGASRKLQVDDFLISGARLRLSSTLMDGQHAPVILPDIHMSNLGQGPDGITGADLTKKLLNEVTLASIQAAKKAATETARGFTEAAKDFGKASNALEKVSKSVGDLFKKK